LLFKVLVVECGFLNLSRTYGVFGLRGFLAGVLEKGFLPDASASP